MALETPTRPDSNVARQRPRPGNITIDTHNIITTTDSQASPIPLISLNNPKIRYRTDHLGTPQSEGPDALANAMTTKQSPSMPNIHLDDAHILGSGSWSNVYRVELDFDALSTRVSSVLTTPLTPPATPQKSKLSSRNQVYAVKAAAYSTANEALEQEASILEHLQEYGFQASEFVIPFYGMANDSTALILHCAETNLEQYADKFAELSQVQESLTNLSSLVTQLVDGLVFIHSASVVHADIKPANILLDFSPNGIQARYADFTASTISDLEPESFLATQDNLNPLSQFTPEPSSPISRRNSHRKSSVFSLSAGGATWSFMAPEQLSSNTDLSEPTYASDVYALGMTLWFYLMGNASPFREVEQQNMFIFREAVKMGDPLRFIKGDVDLKKRLSAINADPVGAASVQLLQSVVKKARNARITAAVWAEQVKTAFPLSDPV